MGLNGGKSVFVRFTSVSAFFANFIHPEANLPVDPEFHENYIFFISLHNLC